MQICLAIDTDEGLWALVRRAYDRSGKRMPMSDSRATRARVGAATRGERGAVERVRAQAARLGRERHPLGRLLAMRGHQAVQVAVSRGTEV